MGAVSILAGCKALGPDFERPALELPAAYPEPGVAAVNDQGVPSDWWRLYRDPVLSAAVERGLARNTDVRIAMARVEEAAAVLREAQSSFLPTVQGNVDAGRSRTSTRTGAPNQGASVRNNYRIAASTAFELDFWGRLRRLREAAGAEFLASRYARDAIELAVAQAIAQAYFTIRSLDAQDGIARESLAATDESVGLVRARAQAGLVSDLDLHQAEGSRAQLAAQLQELRRLRAAALHQLGLLSGRLDLALAATDLRELPLPPLPPAGLPSQLLERRPDVRQAEAAYMAANARIGVARAAQFPTFSLTAALGLQSAELGQLVSAGAGIWSFGLGIVAPVFDAGRNAARTDQAVARARQSAIAYESTVQDAFREVSDALSNLRLAADAERDLGARIEQARAALRLANLRYDAGYSGYLEVLDALRSLNEAQLAFVRNRQAFLGFTVDLMGALGGGWQAL